MYRTDVAYIKTHFNKNSTKFTGTMEQVQQHKSQEQLKHDFSR